VHIGRAHRVFAAAATGSWPGVEDDVHVVRQDEEWQVTLEGRADPLSKHEVREEAVEIGREAARAAKRELLIHVSDGVFLSRDSYGNDPTDRPG